MQQASFRSIKHKMIQALALIKEALDMSMPLLKTQQKNNIIMLWEAFVGEVILYLRRKSKESGINLLAKVSIGRFWFK